MPSRSGQSLEPAYRLMLGGGRLGRVPVSFGGFQAAWAFLDGGKCAEDCQVHCQCAKRSSRCVLAGPAVARAAQRAMGALTVFIALVVIAAALPVGGRCASGSCDVRNPPPYGGVPCQDIRRLPPGTFTGQLLPGIYAARNPDTALDGYYDRYLHIRASVDLSRRPFVLCAMTPAARTVGCSSSMAWTGSQGSLRSWDGHYRGTELRYSTERFALTNQAQSLDATYLEAAADRSSTCSGCAIAGSIRVGFIPNCASVTPRVYRGVKP